MLRAVFLMGLLAAGDFPKGSSAFLEDCCFSKVADVSGQVWRRLKQQFGSCCIEDPKHDRRPGEMMSVFKRETVSGKSVFFAVPSGRYIHPAGQIGSPHYS